MSNGARFDWTEARARLARLAESLETAGARSPAERDRILRERALRLARAGPTPLDESRLEDLLIAAIGGGRFALALTAIVEVVRGVRCAPVPLGPPSLAGVIQVRGEIRPVFHVSRLLDLPNPDPAASGVVLLARVGEREAGLLVDRVEDVRPAAGAERRPAPAGMPHVLWMTHDLIPVLDPARIFPEEME